MIFVQSEATAARRRFPIFLVDATDGITPETGEAAGQPQLSKNGAAWGNTTATLTAIGNGAYYVELTATELDTAGIVIVRYKSANTAEFNLHADVVAVNVNDAVRAGLTALPNAAAQAAGGLYTRGTGAGQINQDANGRIDTRVALMANDVITAAATAADFSTEVNAAVLAVLGALADAAADGDPTSADTLMMYMKQLVNTLVGTVGIPTYPASVAPANGVSLAEVIRNIYDSLFFIAPNTATQLLGATVPSTYGADTVGNIIGNLDNAVAAVQADTDNIQTRLPAALVGGKMDAVIPETQIDQIVNETWDESLASGHDVVLSAAWLLSQIYGSTSSMPALVWDEILASHSIAGSTGEALADVAAGGAGADPWVTPLPGAYGAGTAGKIVGDNLNATVSSRATPAQVNTEVLDVLQTDTFGEPAQGAPAASASLVTKIGYLYKFLRNRVTVTATTISVYDDAATTVDHKSTHSDDATTYSREEFVSGP